MPWKFDQQTKTEGDSEIESLIGAIEDARFIARMIDKGIPLESLAIRGKLQCAVCREIIENYDDARRCENKPMHNDCLKCIRCQRHLGDFQVKFFKNKEGTLFHCEPCLMESGERCPYCKVPIEENHGKIYKGKKYHRRCVELVDVCDECGRSLVESTHMLSLDEPDEPVKEEEAGETIELSGTVADSSTRSSTSLGQKSVQSKKSGRSSQSPSPPRNSSPGRRSHRNGSRKSRSSSQQGTGRKRSTSRKSRSELSTTDEQSQGEEEIEENVEEEKKNILTIKKQYCQECFKHIYNMEICHVCKGPLKKNENETEDEAALSASSLQKALAITKNQLGVDPKMRPGRKNSTSPSSKMVLENAFKFADGQHPEEFLFDDFICHWECMQCHTCKKPVIGEQSFIMAEKHKIWCKFCAEHRFSNSPTRLSPTAASSHSVTPPGGKPSKMSSRRHNRHSPPAPPPKLSGIGSNITIGIGPMDIREFKFNARTAHYELEKLGGASANRTKSNSPRRSVNTAKSITGAHKTRAHRK